MSLVVHKMLPQGRGLARPLLARAATLTLDWGVRRQGRFDATDSHGRALEVSLPSGSPLRGGDVLVAEDGSLVKVLAAPQPVLAVRAAAGAAALDLLRAAYHLGRHQAALELQPDGLRLEPDPALADLLVRMGLTVSQEVAAFEPDAGAPPHVHGPHCDNGGHERHAHGHDHAHHHAHEAAHGHAHGHDPVQSHGQGPASEHV